MKRIKHFTKVLNVPRFVIAPMRPGCDLGEKTNSFSKGFFRSF
jgi:hypothetical protein